MGTASPDISSSSPIRPPSTSASLPRAASPRSHCFCQATAASDSTSSRASRKRASRSTVRSPGPAPNRTVPGRSAKGARPGGAGTSVVPSGKSITTGSCQVDPAQSKRKKRSRPSAGHAIATCPSSPTKVSLTGRSAPVRGIRSAMRMGRPSSPSTMTSVRTESMGCAPAIMKDGPISPIRTTQPHHAARRRGKEKSAVDSTRSKVHCIGNKTGNLPAMVHDVPHHAA